MAVFMLNICKFNSCGLTFKSLGHLIQHIEETHIDDDPDVEQTDQQQQCIPLSYALRFLTDSAKRELLKTGDYVRTINQTTGSLTNDNKIITPAGSEADEGDLTSEPEDSNDSFEELSSDYILRHGTSQGVRVITKSSNNADKPFACPVEGCNKRYKNVNGIKYHKKNGHKNDGKIYKAFKCACGKSYKTPYGLKNHAAAQHNNCASMQLKSPQVNKKSKTVNENEYVRPLIVKIPKVKIPAIEDHGYIKSDLTILTETDIESDNELGILTPASSPSLPNNSPIKNEQKVIPAKFEQMRTLQKYLTTIPSNSNTQRRNVGSKK
ncbi:hypothetical protein HCN44_003460 [Aphidius gifuensis]|uniref:C2H2-type domain-containing protein n=1 Tax=Aphidius gifuensis TaxID=684658 RepID=A0A834XIR5_APHGI|nr:hypothetical protein HCN44_003460 [Aphidius gifuensis]